MTDQNLLTKQLETAERLQSQFRYYFVALIFTLLAASVQTAKLGTGTVQTVAELLGWLLLATSGLGALSYLEWEPLIREQLAHRDEFTRQVNQAKKARLQGAAEIHALSSGSTQTIEERIANLENSAAKLTEAVKKRELIADIKYEIWRWSFVAGLVAILVARGGPALVQVFGYKLL